MDVFIGNLPATATLLKLSAFLEGLDLRTHFQCHQGRDQQDRNYHFVVARTHTREEGLALIARLNGMMFGGQPVEAREYQPRDQAAEWRGPERRVNRL